MHTSALKPYTGQEVFQSFKFLVGFLDGTVSLHVAGDVEADVIDQRNGVGLLPLLHGLRVLLHSSHKLLQLHQLDGVDKKTIRKTRRQVKRWKVLGYGAQLLSQKGMVMVHVDPNLPMDTIWRCILLFNRRRH